MKLEARSPNLLLVFLYSLFLLLIGCAIGIHWSASPATASCLAILGASVFVLHELVTVLFWFGVTAFWIRMRGKSGR